MADDVPPDAYGMDDDDDDFDWLYVEDTCPLAVSHPVPPVVPRTACWTPPALPFCLASAHR